MMRLQYHRGKNFGDQLNPMIFNFFLPGYFSNDDGTPVVLGIGSILGFSEKYSGKKIVLSSGFGDGAESTYGRLPKQLDDFDFISVRGPLTAKLLGLGDEKWVTDGAILLAAMNLKFPKRVQQISFMPHLGSESFYDHERICKALDWQFISPSEPIENVLEKIANSSLVITEAMHGAIVADTLRVPWIPYVGFKTVNAFKWQDWCLSMNLEYKPIQLKPFFSDQKVTELIQTKLNGSFLKVLTLPISGLVRLRMKFIWKENLSTLKRYGTLKHSVLSDESTFQDRLRRMLEKVNEFKLKYPL